jgi:hypothetical protein
MLHKVSCIYRCRRVLCRLTIDLRQWNWGGWGTRQSEPMIQWEATDAVDNRVSMKGFNKQEFVADLEAVAQ